MAMRFGAAFWIQRTGWPELRDAIVRAEAAGFDDLWLDDHLLSDEGDWRDPKLEGWSTLAAVATRDHPGPDRPPRRGQHLPQSRPDRQARDDPRPRQRRPRDPGHRRRLVRARARRLRDRVRRRFRRAARPARGGGAADPAAARRRAGDARRPLLPDARRRVRAAADPGAAADPDRRVRAAQDAAPGRHATRTSGTPTAPRTRSPPPTRSCGRRVRRPAATSTRSSGRRTSTSSCARTAARRTPRGRRGATRTTCGPGATTSTPAGSPDDVAAAIEPYRAAGFEHVIFVFRSPFDLETIDRLPELRAATGG